MDNNDPIQELVPHDHPMILLDRVESMRDRGLTASVVIQADSLFAESEGVPSWVGIEYLGQAVAAYAGMCARREGRPVRIGFLVSTRHYEPGCTHFPIGTRLEIGVDAVTDNVNGLRVFAGTIKGKNITMATKLNVFMPENVEEFLLERS